MKVQIDNLWSSPSTLHARVTVWADDGRWRHKYDVAVPVEEIPEEALAPIWASLSAGPPADLREQLPLF